MIFPFDVLNGHLREIGLIMAVVIGFGFGFVLERAGFGRANKLAAQFYLYDMTVFKVMFGAIVTALLGMILFSQLGLVDLRAVADMATSGTFLWPMLVGGLVLGFGFIIASYCPGTSIVAAASGNIDGMVTLLGVIIGTFIYSEIYPLISKFHNSSDLGHLYLYDLLRIPAPAVALLVTAMAVGCFFGAEKVERLFRAQLNIPSDDEAILFAPAPRRFTFALFAGVAVLGVLLLTVPKEPAIAAGKVGTISQAELATEVLGQPWKLRILDLRAAAECEKMRIPGSECTPLEMLASLNIKEDVTGIPLLLVADQDLNSVPPAIVGYSGNILLLTGGFAGWRSFALTRPEPPVATASETEQKNFRLRSAVFAAMTGTKQPPPPPPRPMGGASGGGKKKGGGCSG